MVPVSGGIWLSWPEFSVESKTSTKSSPMGSLMRTTRNRSPKSLLGSLRHSSNGLRFNTYNLKQHAFAGLEQAFVALHLGYHHYATLLYFCFFDIQLSQTRSRAISVSRCKHHARKFSDLLRTSHEIPGCEAIYLIAAHLAVVSSAALLHTLLFGNQDEIINARNRLHSNLEIQLKLKVYWPVIDLGMFQDHMGSSD